MQNLNFIGTCNHLTVSSVLLATGQALTLVGVLKYKNENYKESAEGLETKPKSFWKRTFFFISLNAWAGKKMFYN